MTFSSENENAMKRGWMLLLFVAAYVFSIAIRMIWVSQMGDNPNFIWNNELMINTNDGYYFASGAQQELFGTLQHNPRVPDWLSYGVVFFTTILVQYSPFSLDTVILYLPAIVSSIVVIPIILIGRLYGSTLAGFFAALIGAIAWSYYNRTMTGYYDTDMFSAMMPMFILYFLLATLETEKRIYMLLSALSILIYPFLYDSGLSLIYAMGLLYMGYMAVFHRQDTFTWHSIILIAIALMGIPFWVKFALVIGLYFVFLKTVFTQQKLMVAAAVAVLLFLYTGNVFTIIWDKFSGYYFRGVDESGGLRFYEVAQTVREAGQIPFDVMANRISGSVPGVLAALVGYLLLVVRHRGFVLALPLIGIGVFSLWGGLRFTVYAVPVAAISVVYLFIVISRYLENKLAKIAMVAALTGAMLYPNITHIIGYKVPTVFGKPEVEALDRLSKMGSDKDYVLTWWDFGYPIWYYANKNTLIDGGKHNHDNFLISQMMLGDSQLEAARLSRLSVETYIASHYRIVADELFRNGKPDQVDVGNYLETLQYGSPEIPSATRDVYWFLPFKMLRILPTVAAFSNRDLNSGQNYPDHFFYQARQMKESKEMIDLGGGVALLKRSGNVRLGQSEVPLKSFYTLRADKNGKMQVSENPVHSNGRLSIVYLPNYGTALLMDEYFLNSNYIQMFLFDRYDSDLFEPVVKSPLVKIYKLKI